MTSNMLTRSEMERKITVLHSSVDTVSLQIKKLGKHVSSLQLTMWRKYKTKLNRELNTYKRKLKKSNP